MLTDFLSFQPNALTRWAAKNAFWGAIAVAVIQLSQLAIGFYLGQNALPDIPRLALLFFILWIIATIVWLRNQTNALARQETNKAKAFPFIAAGNAATFTATFLLSILAGNQFAERSFSSSDIDSFAAVTEEMPVSINSDSLLNVLEKEQNAQNLKSLKKEIRKKTKALPMDDRADGMQRFGYFLLFVLGGVLTYIGLYLACNLACSGYGVAAALVFLLDIGIFGGAIYFLLKVFREGTIKKWKDMDAAERKREWKIYLKATLISALIVVGVYLLTILLN